MKIRTFMVNSPFFNEKNAKEMDEQVNKFLATIPPEKIAFITPSFAVKSSGVMAEFVYLITIGIK